MKIIALFILTILTNIAIAKEKEPKYEYQLAAALMFQNEAEHLQEWIEYHKLVGFEHFYLFNNLSTDNYLEVVQPYVDSGEVELYEYPWTSVNQSQYLHIQCTIYMHALSLAKGKVKWLALIDADEYVTPLKQGASVADILNKYDYAGGVYLNWLMFGTSHVEKIPKDKLMIETLIYCGGKLENLGKTIVRPERVSKCSDPHRMWYFPPYEHVNLDGKTFDWICPVAQGKLLICHFFTGDLNHLINIKYPRRKHWVNLELESYIESLEEFNTNYSPIMQRFVPLLRKKLFGDGTTDT